LIRFVRITSPTAVTRFERVRVLRSLREVEVAVGVDPAPEVEIRPGVEAEVGSENMPNWKTGTATVCKVRRIRTSELVAVRAVAVIV